MKFEEIRIRDVKIKIGDVVNITIKDCGSGVATLMYIGNSSRENYITIRMYRNTFIPCYNGQSIDNPFMVVDIDDIEQLEIIEDVYKELNSELIKRKLVHSPRYEENDCSEAVLSEVYDWGFVIYRRDEIGQFYLFYDNNYRLVTHLCIESDCYEITGNFEVSGNILTIKTSDGKVNKYNLNLKEGITMSKNVKENNQTSVKEETKMTTNILLTKAYEIFDVLKNNQKTQDKHYLDKKALRKELEVFEFPFNNRTTRTQMVEALNNFIKEQENIADEISYGNIPETAPVESVPAVPVNDITKIFELVIKKADNNHQHNFISDWMLKSCISEIVIGVPLKEKKGGKMVEHYKSFTEEQKALINKKKDAFIKKANLKATKDANGNITGYFMPAKAIIYGRSTFLGKQCLYRYKDEVLYYVGLDGVINTRSGVTTPLSDDVYKALDDKYIFIA